MPALEISGYVKATRLSFDSVACSQGGLISAVLLFNCVPLLSTILCLPYVWWSAAFGNSHSYSLLRQMYLGCCSFRVWAWSTPHVPPHCTPSKRERHAAEYPGTRPSIGCRGGGLNRLRGSASSSRDQILTYPLFFVHTDNRYYLLNCLPTWSPCLFPSIQGKSHVVITET